MSENIEIKSRNKLTPDQKISILCACIQATKIDADLTCHGTELHDLHAEMASRAVDLALDVFDLIRETDCLN
jgi:hypothetical protein